MIKLSPSMLLVVMYGPDTLIAAVGETKEGGGRFGAPPPPALLLL